MEKYGAVVESWHPIGHGSKQLIHDLLFAKLDGKERFCNVSLEEREKRLGAWKPAD